VQDCSIRVESSIGGLHCYAIQFLLVSKFRHAMQSKHQTEVGKGQRFLYLLYHQFILHIVRFFLTVATCIAELSYSVSGVDCYRVTTLSKVKHLLRDIGIARKFVHLTVLPMLLLCTSGRAIEHQNCMYVSA